MLILFSTKGFCSWIWNELMTLPGPVCKCRILIWTEKWFHSFYNSFHDCLIRLDTTENLSQSPLWRVVEFPPQHGTLLRCRPDWDQRLKYFENKKLNYNNFFVCEGSSQLLRVTNPAALVQKLGTAQGSCLAEAYPPSDRYVCIQSAMHSQTLGTAATIGWFF